LEPCDSVPPNWWVRSAADTALSTITDGTSVMIKFGRDTRPLHIDCLAHAVYLCVCDVLHKEKRKSGDCADQNNVARDTEEEESDEAKSETAADKLVDELPTVVLDSEFRTIVAKIRKTVRMKLFTCLQCAMMTICNLKTLLLLEKRKLFSLIAKLDGIVFSNTS